MKKIICILILSIAFPFSVSALEEGIKINCPNSIEKNQTIRCELIGYANYEVSSVDYTFSLGKGLNFKEFIIDDTWLGEEYNNRVIVYTGENKRRVSIGEFVLETNSQFENLKIDTKELIFVNDKFEDLYIVKNSVKESKSEETNKEIKKNSGYKYVIILIIGVFVIFLLLFIVIKKRRKTK